MTTEEIFKMNADREVLPEVKKAIDLFVNGTYNESEFYSHVLTIIRDQTAEAIKHKQRLESLLFKLNDLQHKQARFWGGQKSDSLLGECKKQEQELVMIVKRALASGIYDISRYTQQATQPKLL